VEVIRLGNGRGDSSVYTIGFKLWDLAANKGFDGWKRPLQDKGSGGYSEETEGDW